MCVSVAGLGSDVNAPYITRGGAERVYQIFTLSQLIPTNAMNNTQTVDTHNESSLSLDPPFVSLSFPSSPSVRTLIVSFHNEGLTSLISNRKKDAGN